jgi:ArsR family transcriptional regulator, zinc-responsive transcriptional repressor
VKDTNQQMNETEIEKLADLFHLLSDKTRLTILLLLSDGGRNVTWLCDKLQLPQPTVSHHLGLLRNNHLLASRREGKQVFYALNGRIDNENQGNLSIHAADYVVGIAQRGNQLPDRA